jgi:hypothetical protein
MTVESVAILNGDALLVAKSIAARKFTSLSRKRGRDKGGGIVRQKTTSSFHYYLKLTIYQSFTLFLLP